MDFLATPRTFITRAPGESDATAMPYYILTYSLAYLLTYLLATYLLTCLLTYLLTYFYHQAPSESDATAIASQLTQAIDEPHVWTVTDITDTDALQTNGAAGERQACLGHMADTHENERQLSSFTVTQQNCEICVSVTPHSQNEVAMSDVDKDKCVPQSTRWMLGYLEVASRVERVLSSCPRL